MASLKVRVTGLGKDFKLYARPVHRLIEMSTFGVRSCHRTVTVLDDITFEVPAGCGLGIVGGNGAGKSTLLKILSGVLAPTRGGFEINGRITSLLELGTGFNPELDAVANIGLSARFLGLGRKEIREDEILAFADLAEHADVPIKYFSTGMVVRLAFSLFASIKPDIFVVDEALSVGDAAFTRKCFVKLDQLRSGGCTLIVVTHDLALVRKYCDQGFVLRHGRIAYRGDALSTTDYYLESTAPGLSSADHVGDLGVAACLEDEGDAELLRSRFSDTRGPFDRARVEHIGIGGARLIGARVLSSSGRPQGMFAHGEAMRIRVLCRCGRRIDAGALGIQVVTRLGYVVWGTDTIRNGGSSFACDPGDVIDVTFALRLNLGPDDYHVDISVGDGTGLSGHVFDRVANALTFSISDSATLRFHGATDLKAEISIEINRQAGESRAAWP